MSETDRIINRSDQGEQEGRPVSCQNYVPVLLQPYAKSKLAQIKDNKLLYENDATVYQAMYRVHTELNGLKNLYFYVRRANGKYVQISHETKFKSLFQRFKGKEGVLKIYYNNDYIGRNKFLDYAFYAAQIVVAIYLILLGIGYLRMHEYI